MDSTTSSPGGTSGQVITPSDRHKLEHSFGSIKRTMVHSAERDVAQLLKGTPVKVLRFRDEEDGETTSTTASSSSLQSEEERHSRRRKSHHKKSKKKQKKGQKEDDKPRTSRPLSARRYRREDEDDAELLDDEEEEEEDDEPVARRLRPQSEPRRGPSMRENVREGNSSLAWDSMGEHESAALQSLRERVDSLARENRIRELRFAQAQKRRQHEDHERLYVSAPVSPFPGAREDISLAVPLSPAAAAGHSSPAAHSASPFAFPSPRATPADDRLQAEARSLRRQRDGIRLFMDRLYEAHNAASLLSIIEEHLASSLDAEYCILHILDPQLVSADTHATSTAPAEPPSDSLFSPEQASSKAARFATPDEATGRLHVRGFLSARARQRGTTWRDIEARTPGGTKNTFRSTSHTIFAPLRFASGDVVAMAEVGRHEDEQEAFTGDDLAALHLFVSQAAASLAVFRTGRDFGAFRERTAFTQQHARASQELQDARRQLAVQAVQLESAQTENQSLHARADELTEKHSELQSQSATVNGKLAHAEQRLAELETRTRRQAAELEGHVEQNKELETARSELEERVAAQEQELRQLRRTVPRQEAQISQLQHELSTSTEELEASMAKLQQEHADKLASMTKRSSEELESAQADIAKLREAWQAERDGMRAKQIELQTSMDSQLHQLRLDKSTLQSQLDNEKANAARLDMQRESLEERLNELRDAHSELRADSLTLSRRAEDTENELRKVVEERDALKQAASAADAAHRDAIAELQATTKQLDELQRQHAREQEARETAEESLEETTKQLERQRAEYAQLKGAARKIDLLITGHKEQLRAKDEEAEERDRKIEALEARNRQLVQQNESTSEQLREAKSSQTRLLQERASLHDEVEHQAKAIKNLEQASAEEKKTLANVRLSLREAKAEHDRTMQLKQDLEHEVETLKADRERLVERTETLDEQVRALNDKMQEERAAQHETVSRLQLELGDLQSQKQLLEQQLKAAQHHFEQELEAEQAKHEQQERLVRAEAAQKIGSLEKRLSGIEEQHASELDLVRARHAQELHSAKSGHEQELNELKSRHESDKLLLKQEQERVTAEALDKLRHEHAEILAEVQEEHRVLLEQTTEEYETQIAERDSELDQLQLDLEHEMNVHEPLRHALRNAALVRRRAVQACHGTMSRVAKLVTLASPKRPLSNFWTELAMETARSVSCHLCAVFVVDKHRTLLTMEARAYCPSPVIPQRSSRAMQQSSRGLFGDEPDPDLLSPMLSPRSPRPSSSSPQPSPRSRTIRMGWSPRSPRTPRAPRTPRTPRTPRSPGGASEPPASPRSPYSWQTRAARAAARSSVTSLEPLDSVTFDLYDKHGVGHGGTPSVVGHAATTGMVLNFQYEASEDGSGSDSAAEFAKRPGAAAPANDNFPKFSADTDAWWEAAADEQHKQLLHTASNNRAVTVLCHPVVDSDGVVLAIVQCVRFQPHDPFATEHAYQDSTTIATPKSVGSPPTPGPAAAAPQDSKFATLRVTVDGQDAGPAEKKRRGRGRGRSHRSKRPLHAFPEALITDVGEDGGAGSRDDVGFLQHEVELLAWLCPLAARLLESHASYGWLQWEMSQTHKELETVRENFASALKRNQALLQQSRANALLLDLEAALGTAANQSTRQLFDVVERFGSRLFNARAALFLVDGKKRQCVSMRSGQAEPVAFHQSRGLAGYVSRRGVAAAYPRLEDAEEPSSEVVVDLRETEWYVECGRDASHLGAPCVDAGGDVVGVIELCRPRSAGTFSATDATLLQVACGRIQTYLKLCRQLHGAAARDKQSRQRLRRAQQVEARAREAEAIENAAETLVKETQRERERLEAVVNALQKRLKAKSARVLEMEQRYGATNANEVHELRKLVVEADSKLGDAERRASDAESELVYLREQLEQAHRVAETEHRNRVRLQRDLKRAMVSLKHDYVQRGAEDLEDVKRSSGAAAARTPRRVVPPSFFASLATCSQVLDELEQHRREE